tara:strand:- start:30 stop:857 length:828 start_codon:yes stop_codon:yes gene_type:complete
MSIVVDQYPMETLSFDNLPQDSPVSYLDYGGILSQIGELVKKKRKENHNKRRDFLIKKINNINLGILIDKIKKEAQHLESYRAKEWNKGPCNKTNYLKFFQSHDISLKYLEDMYEVQSKGKPIIVLNTLIKIKKDWHTDAEYGVVVECIGKHTVKYVPVNKDMLPAMYKWSGKYYTYHTKINVWKCEVVGEFTPDNWTAYSYAINDYNRNMKCRKEFWKNHPVLSGLNIPYQYYDMRIDVMNGELPTRMWPGHRQIWHIFKDCIDEKLRLERENQ